VQSFFPMFPPLRVYLKAQENSMLSRSLTKQMKNSSLLQAATLFTQVTPPSVSSMFSPPGFNLSQTFLCTISPPLHLQYLFELFLYVLPSTFNYSGPPVGKPVPVFPPSLNIFPSSQVVESLFPFPSPPF